LAARQPEQALTALQLLLATENWQAYVVDDSPITSGVICRPIYPAMVHTRMNYAARSIPFSF
jgi:hypothetical protein